jgi:uncharacterized protein (TIRG00374 family)
MRHSLSSDNQESLQRMHLGSARGIELRSKRIKIILTILKILAGFFLFFLSLRGIQFEKLADGIRTAKLTWLALGILAVLFGLGLKLWRWRILIRNYHIHASFARLFSAFFVGQSANIVLPLRGGELIRLGYFVEEKATLPGVAATIFLEKYLDLLALTASIVWVSLKFSLDNILNLHRYLLPTTIIITVLLLFVILIGPSLWKKIHSHGWLPQRLIVWLDSWAQASRWLRNPWQFIPSVLLTIVIWLVMWSTNLLLFKSLGLSLGGTAGGLVLVLVYIGLLPALMPGNIGPFYFFATLALFPFGVLPDQALTFAVILHAIVTLPPLLGGGLGLFIRSPHPYRT